MENVGKVYASVTVLQEIFRPHIKKEAAKPQIERDESSLEKTRGTEITQRTPNSSAIIENSPTTL